MNYISCFVRKEKPLKEYEFEYKTHMYKLHEKYKTELKPNQKAIDKKFVIDYVNALHPAQQMFLINYKSPQVKGSSCAMSYDTSVVCANTCPTSVISESSKEEMDCTI
jgi:hypothetical protein